MKNRFYFLLVILLTVTPAIYAGWTFHNPTPAGNELNAIASHGRGQYVMSGEGGYLLEYDGSNFSAPFFNTYQRVHDIEISSSGGIAACERADVALLQNGNWIINRPASSAWFYGAAITPGGDYWVCGDAGEIHRFSSGTWEEVSSTTSSTLKDIDMVSDSSGWAVGLFGTARIWDGTSWSYASSQTSRFLRSVDGFSDTRAWAVGDLGTIIMWTATGFQQETGVNNENLYDVVAISDSEAWAVGDNGTVLRRTASGWELYSHASLPEDIDFRSLVVNDPDDMMIVGSLGVIMHFDGTDWLPLKNDSLDALDINTVHVDSVSGNVLLAGDRGKIFEYDGTTYSQQTTGVPNMVFTIREDLSGNLWAGCSDGLLLEDTGSGWNSVNTDDTEDIRDIDFLPGGDIWTAGGCDDGSCVSWAVLHYDGGNWTKYGESGS